MYLDKKYISYLHTYVIASYTTRDQADMIYHFSISAVDNTMIYGDFQKYTHSAYFSTKNRKSQIMTKKWNIGCGMGYQISYFVVNPSPLF